jgi:MTH538 TIR-like domain (DUF1863)
MARHNCFISFHRADERAVLEFKRRFDDTQDAFIYRGQAMPDDIINSENDEYVISEIRRRFLQNTTVTIVLVGRCTWSRKFVDWEVQASLRQPADGLPNGLLAVVLDPNHRANPAPWLPERVRLNVESGYAKYQWFPSTGSELASWIDDAYLARTSKTSSITNPRARKAHDDWCA